MKINISDRIVTAIVITTLASAGVSIAADGDRGSREEQRRDQRVAQQEEKPRPQQKVQSAQQEQKQDQQQRERAEQKSAQEQQERRAWQRQQQERVERQSELMEKQRRAQQAQRQGQIQEQRQQQRLSQQRQQELIRQQQQRVDQYRRHLEQQERLAREHAALLERQKRMAQHRFQQEYLERVRQQQIYLRDQRFDYDRDPYFYTAPIYRYNRGGSYYEINEYGAKTLRQAVNYGYEEGFRAGRADRDDRWGSDYKDSYAYRDANYGYSGYYVNRDDYNYYFREGFRRGYEDGYNSRYRYGRFADGNPSILETILTQILNFQSMS
ncbi:MAG: hypothetical protein ACXWXZ_12115 [Candidatus Binatia bacterium]